MSCIGRVLLRGLIADGWKPRFWRCGISSIFCTARQVTSYIEKLIEDDLRAKEQSGSRPSRSNR